MVTLVVRGIAKGEKLPPWQVEGTQDYDSQETVLDAADDDVAAADASGDDDAMAE